MSEQGLPRLDPEEVNDPMCQLFDFAQWGESFTKLGGIEFNDRITEVIEKVYPQVPDNNQ